jgi:hypothetical protein
VVADVVAAKALEIAAIRSYKRSGHDLVNGTEGGEGFTGTHREESREKMRAAALARIERDPEHLANIRARKGPITDEYREKMSMVMTGKPKSHEHAMKVGAAHKGRPKSPESVAKMRETKLAQGVVMSDEARAHLSAVWKGKPKSEETRARMREAQQKRFAAARDALKDIFPT